MKEIPLKICKSSCHYNPPESASAMVDDEDYEMLMTFSKTWLLNVGGYASATRVSKTMHRLIMGLKRGDPLIDHKDTNRLNNQKYNLILATHRENKLNTLAEPKTKSGFKGVLERTNVWLMQHKFKDGTRLCETYTCKYAAAYAYNKYIDMSMDRGYRNDLSECGFTIEELESKLITDRSPKRWTKPRPRNK